MTGLLRAGWQGGLWFPNASNTGANLTGSLTAVPGTNSGPGWAWDASTSTVNITGSDTVAGLAISGAVKITANGVTLTNCSVTNGITVSGSSGSPVTGCTIGNCAVTVLYNAGEVIITEYATGMLIHDCTLSGLNTSWGRADYAIEAAEGGDSLTVLRCDISAFRVGFSCAQGWIQDCYIHDPGFFGPDHTDGIDCEGNAAPLTILHNTILIPITETAPIHLNGSSAQISGVTIQDNLLAGGGYAIYGGNTGSHGSPTDMISQGNWFSTMYFPDCGEQGPVADWYDTGNTWSNNVWFDGPLAGQLITV